jgi:hypothetical protein
MAHRLIPLTPPLFFHFTLPLSSPPSLRSSLCEYVLYTVYTYTVCKGEGTRTNKTPAAKSLYGSIF